uniref:At1g61320/AtMIF1 LRR domain-containing protein n=1 Tax=Aegilops tauschii TaxID=37682 RepID=R7W0P4_AEGTA
MPLRDAARLACVSRKFWRSWRCYPKLDLRQETLGLNGDLISKVDSILKNHSGVGLKELNIELSSCDKVDSCYISSWLRIAVTAGIEELSLFLPHIPEEEENCFPCSPLLNGSENSIWYLDIGICAFRPTAGLGHWRSLTRLYLSSVRVADDELEGLLYSCDALEHLGVLNCPEIVCLKIPCLLQRLRLLTVSLCRNLQVIDCNAPNISIFHFSGSLVSIFFESALQVKNVEMDCLEFGQSNIVLHARTKLLSYAPNVETLAISSPNEMISTPMLPSKFLCLKYLHISLIGDEAISPAYDYLSLVSFLEASPCLETFILEVRQPYMKHDSVVEDSSHLRWLPQQRHNSLKSVTIVGFCSAKSLVELTCHIVENATSLERLTLDTTHGCQSSGGCSVDKPNRWFYAERGILMAAPPDRCLPMGEDILMESHRARLAIRRHVERQVPSGVVLKVVEPCSRCIMLNF